MINANIRLGLFLALTLSLYFIATNLLKLSGESWVGWLTYACYLPFIYKVQKTNVSYGSKVKSGFVISAIGALISSVFMYFYLRFVDDSMIRKAVQHAIDALDQSAQDFDAQVVQLTESVTPMFYLIFGIVGGILIGTLISVIMPLFLRKSGD